MADIAGVRIRDRSTGAVTVEITDRLTRVIGTVNSGSSNGSINVPGIALGDGWAAVIEAQLPNQEPSRLFSYPVVSVSGSTISWVFSNYSGQSYTIVPCDIIYGVY